MIFYISKKSNNLFFKNNREYGSRLFFFYKRKHPREKNLNFLNFNNIIAAKLREIELDLK